MAEGGEAAATMKDVEEMKASLTSLVDKRMDELRELIAQIASAQATTPSASSAPNDNSSEHVNVEDDGAGEGEGEGKEGGDKDKTKIPKKSPPPMGKVKERNTMRFLQITLPTHSFPILI
jgi:ribosomal protein L12E/L44/L45/RPP1/RPP2